MNISLIETVIELGVIIWVIRKTELRKRTCIVKAKKLLFSIGVSKALLINLSSKALIDKEF